MTLASDETSRTTRSADDGLEENEGAAPPERDRRGIWLERCAAVAFSFLLAAICLFLYTRHNDFTFLYHPDERGKVSQVQSDGMLRNLNHPMLLLEASHWAVKWLDTPSDPQPTVEVGRLVSAVFSAGAAVALAWVGYAAGGLLGMILVGSVVGLCPQLLTYAHYMKEEPALILGIAVALLGSRMTWDARRWWTRLIALSVLGMGVGLAASGKYVGAVTLTLALPVAVVAPKMWWISRPLAPLWVLAVALAVAMAINHRAVNDLETITAELPAAAEAGLNWTERGERLSHAFFKPSIIGAFERELEHSTTHHGDVTMDRPNTFFLSLFDVEVMLHIRILAVIYLVCIAGTILWKRRRWWDVWVIGFAGLYLAILSMSVIPFNRYFLPVAMMTYLFAGLGLVALVNAFSEGWRSRAVAMGLALTLVCVVQGMRCVNYLEQFADDSRYRVRVWMAENLPAGTRIVAETYTMLHTRGDHRPSQQLQNLNLRVQSHFFAPHAGAIETLKRRRIEYVAISDQAYARFFIPEVKSHEDREGQIERYRDWYTALDRDHELVWSSTPDHNMYANTNPEIKVYKLSD